MEEFLNRTRAGKEKKTREKRCDVNPFWYAAFQIKYKRSKKTRYWVDAGTDLKVQISLKKTSGIMSWRRVQTEPET